MPLPAATAPAAILSPQTASPACVSMPTAQAVLRYVKHMEVAVVGYRLVGSTGRAPSMLRALPGAGGEMPDSEEEQVDGRASVPEDLNDRLDDEIAYLTGTSGALVPGLSKVSCAATALSVALANVYAQQRVPPLTAAGETDVEGGMDSDASEFFNEGFDPQAALQRMGEEPQDGSGAQPFQVIGVKLVVVQHTVRVYGAGTVSARKLERCLCFTPWQVLQARSRAASHHSPVSHPAP